MVNAQDLPTGAKVDKSLVDKLNAWLRKPWLLMILTVGPSVVLWFIISFLVHLTN